MIIAEPDLFIIPKVADIEYAILGSKGVFRVLSKEQIDQIVWDTVDQYRSQGKAVYQECLAKIVDTILEQATIRKSDDNLTAILVALKSLY